MCVVSHVWFFATPSTIALETPLSMGFSRQEYLSGLPSPPPGDLPDPGIKPVSPASPALADGFFALWHLGNPRHTRKLKFNGWLELGIEQTSENVRSVKPEPWCWKWDRYSHSYIIPLYKINWWYICYLCDTDAVYWVDHWLAVIKDTWIMEETRELKGGIQSHHSVHHLIFVNERTTVWCRKGEGHTSCCV